MKQFHAIRGRLVLELDRYQDGELSFFLPAREVPEIQAVPKYDFISVILAGREFVIAKERMLYASQDEVQVRGRLLNTEIGTRIHDGQQWGPWSIWDKEF